MSIFDESVFGKENARITDYKPMTWKKFIKLRQCAKNISEHTGYPIYLVGSTLLSDRPRDFDIVMIIPYEEYENMFGKVDDKNVYSVIGRAFNYFADPYYFQLINVLGGFGKVSLDFKVYPDTWFVNKDKILLS